MKGTRICISDALNQGKYIALVLQAKLLGLVRTEVWQRFGSTNGEVGQADTNAACNILHRLDDPEIRRYTPYRKVKQILQNRLHASEELIPKSWMTAPSGL